MRPETSIVITGAARGQGAAHAAELARPGVRIIMTDVLDDDGERAAAVLRAAGGDVVYRHLDVSDPAGWAALADELRHGDAPVSGLVNNAGILRHASIADTPLSVLELHERVNVHGPFLGMQALGPLMAGAGRGSIVNVASTAALVGSAGYLAYSASKAAVIGMTRVAAVEFAPVVRVNAICPGGVATPMNDDEPEGGSSTGTPLGRRASVEEISPLIAFLLSERSSFVTGSILTIDGGLTAV
ncbi:SDR family oxidoreductase [Pseudoclavibacter chungangensis]|uniref:SDR family oxidoreductase n=1 Tax=Pseudoclavibacter chungangensis TaxID=587635 RepID=A0A7J5BW98_9MICO|nr:SDR family oxidoreductase [Pseudoclavibacter chungangensis]KAB1657820.1 SDR family oxidoreductase [Pseudoclavibacter chungangensis]NYJ66586.1 3alpha(or 20beta)-hydroxysteroid dehydrogenase [Pseudoclavibacter chungangensis]